MSHHPPIVSVRKIHFSNLHQFIFFQFQVFSPEGDGSLPECLEDHEDVEGVLSVDPPVVVEVQLTLILVEAPGQGLPTCRGAEDD